MGVQKLCAVVLLAAFLASSDAFAPSLASITKSLPLPRRHRTATATLQAQFFGTKEKESKSPPTGLKDARGNNIGDARYTVSYNEDLSLEVEDLPSGTTEQFIRELALRLKASPVPKDLRPGKITYKNSMVGTEVVDWMLKERIAANRRVAVAYGRELIRKAEVVHVARGHDFKDEDLFYRFVTPYEKGLINPKTPYEWFLRWAATPPLTFSVIFAFLFFANLPFIVPGAPDIFGLVPK